MAEGPKDGELFRRNYLRSTVKLSDSARARKRILRSFFDMRPYSSRDFVAAVEGELGIDYPALGGRPNHENFWKNSQIGDMLSAITLWMRHANDDDQELIIAAVRRIFSEEDLHYRLDAHGGVHFLVDEEFYQISETTLAGLTEPRFGAARAALQDGLKALAPAKQSGKSLIRGVFEAVESAFLVVIGPGNSNRLNKQSVEKYLKPILLDRYNNVPEADDKVSRMLETFNTWVNEAHPYRHGAPFEQIHEAPLDLAILSATTGMGFIRFLAGLVHKP